MSRSGLPGFHIDLSQNRYLSAGESAMHAVLTVRSQGAAATPPPQAAEVLLVDCSASMEWPPSKLAAARRAAAAAIDTLRDGVHFGVVQGTSGARMVYPAKRQLVPANPDTRAAAKSALSRLIPGGGTAMGTWLALAARLFDRHPDAIRHAILLTDGKNESESAEQLDRALAECEGRFACDARGIGDHWVPHDLERICSVLNGRADAVVEDADLVEDFRLMIEVAMGRVVPDFRLRVTTAPFAALRFAKQVFPVQVDLTARAQPAGGRAVEVPTGAWGDEHREYHLCFEVDQARLPRFEDIQLARVEPVVIGPDGAAAGPPVPVLAFVTDDDVLSSRIDEKVGLYTLQADLRDAVRAGWTAFESGERAAAERDWARAVRLATELGNGEVLARLARLADIDGTVVRLRENVRPRDGFSLVFGSTISDFSARLPAPGGPPPARATGPDRVCRACTRVLPTAARVCGQCGTPQDAAGDPR